MYNYLKNNSTIAANSGISLKPLNIISFIHSFINWSSYDHSKLCYVCNTP